MEPVRVWYLSKVDVPQPFALMADEGFGELHLVRDGEAGLVAVVAIHDTRLGPALGGCRFRAYPSELEALADALRLARGMTYKAAVGGLPHGGGKAVILQPERAVDRERLFQSFGGFIDALGGRYITAEDSGTTADDMEAIARRTRHVVGRKREHGGLGDPSPSTALGVRCGIEGCVRVAMDRTDIEGVHVVVIGVGSVGYRLCAELHARGARLTVADVDPARVEHAREAFGCDVVSCEQAHTVECDVLAPCALGGLLDEVAVGQLRCRIVAGSANNQLASPADGERLMRRGIIYAPDFVINAGGLIQVAQEAAGGEAGEALRSRIEAIADRVHSLVSRSRVEGVPAEQLALRLAEERLAGGSGPLE